MKNFIKKVFGIDKIEAAKEAAKKELLDAQLETEKAKQESEIAKMSPKERATAKGEPWVAVLDTHVNKDNIRNGFFELDWNPEFIVQLKQAGYGFDGDPDEEIVDRWFRELASNMFMEQGLDPRNRTAGFINVVPLTKGKSEVS